MTTKEKQLLECAKDLVCCIRNCELGDYSPLMDEIFDIEDAIRQYGPFDERAKARRKGNVTEIKISPLKCNCNYIADGHHYYNCDLVIKGGHHNGYGNGQ